ncbi:LPD38 domain-containing protein [Rhodocyclaceae bacterium SMB388]
MTPTTEQPKPRQPRPWVEVQADPGFQQLAPEQQTAARRQYFDQVVAPRIPEVGRRRAAWDQFSNWQPEPAPAEDKPGFVRRTINAVGEARQALQDQTNRDDSTLAPQPLADKPIQLIPRFDKKPDSVMADLPEQPRSGPPVTPAARNLIQQLYDRQPERRAELLARQDWAGQVAREIDGGYQKLDQAAHSTPLDTRREALVDRARAAGATPDTAESMATGGDVRLPATIDERPEPLADRLARMAAEQTGEEQARTIVRGAVDLAGSIAKVAPTTGKMALDTAQLIPLIGRAAEIGSDALAEVIDDIGSMQSGEMQGQAARLAEVVRTGTPDQIVQLLVQNPQLLADVAIPSAGSVFLIGGAGSAIGKAQAARYADRLSPRALARIQQRAATEGAIWTNAAVNAGAAYDETEGGQLAKYTAALIAGAGTRAVGGITKGGAEGTIARGGEAAARNPLRTIGGVAGREIAQEFGEGGSEALGTQTGEIIEGGRDSYDWRQLANQATLEAAAAGPIGAAVGAMSARTADERPEPTLADQIDATRWDPRDIDQAARAALSPEQGQPATLPRPAAPAIPPELDQIRRERDAAAAATGDPIEAVVVDLENRAMVETWLRSPEGQQAEAEAGALDTAQLLDQAFAATRPIVSATGQPFRSERLAAISAKQRGLDAVPIPVENGWGLVPVQQVQANIEQVQADIEPTQQTQPDPIAMFETEQWAEPLLGARGPFRTERAAAISAKQRGLDMIPVEVEGGWGLIPSTATPAGIEAEPVTPPPPPATLTPAQFEQAQAAMANVADAFADRPTDAHTVRRQRNELRSALINSGIAPSAAKLIIDEATTIRAREFGDRLHGFLAPRNVLAAIEQLGIAPTAQINPVEIDTRRDQVVARMDQIEAIAAARRESGDAVGLPSPGEEVAAAQTRLQAKIDARRERAPTRAPADPEAFAKWFEGSQAVDDDGNPMRLYHGTRFGSTAALVPTYHDETGGLRGIAFTPDREVAARHANNTERPPSGQQPHIIEAFVQAPVLYTLREFQARAALHYDTDYSNLTEAQVVQFARDNDIRAIDMSEVGESGEVFVLDLSAIGLVEPTNEAAPAPRFDRQAPAPAARPARTRSDGRTALLAEIEQARTRTAPAELVAEYSALLAEAQDARRRAGLKKTKQAEAKQLTARADVLEDTILPELRERIGYVNFKSATGNYRILNTPDNLTEFAKRVSKTAAFKQLPKVETVYDSIETRPGTTEAQRTTGRRALDALVDSINRRSGGGSVSVLGNALYADFTERGGTTLVGQVIESPADLATLAQVFRDPRFETFRAIYLDADNRVVGEAGYSSRLPAAVHLPNDIEAWIDRDRTKFGASKYYVLHNHPSGTAKPSDSDLNLTRAIADNAHGFAGHVVIDRNEYAVIAKDGSFDVIQAPELDSIDFNSKPTTPHRLLGLKIARPVDVTMMAKALQTPDGHATLILTRRDGKVHLIMDAPMALLQDASRAGVVRAKALMRRAARATGAGGHRFVVLPDGVPLESLTHMLTAGIVIDVVSPDGSSLHERIGARWPGDFLDRATRRAAQVREQASPYKQPPPAETKARAFQRVWQDKFNRFTVIQDWLKSQGVKLTEGANVYRAEERMHGRTATRMEDFREKRVRPIVQKIRDAGLNLAEVADFLHAQHAIERNRQIAKINSDMPDGGSGMTDAEAAAKLLEYRKKPELAQLANELRAITDDTRAILLRAGLITQEMSDAWTGAYQHYVPLRGGPDTDASVQGTGKGLTVKEKQKRALGHGTRTEGEWIIENILQSHERAILQSEKNRVGQHLLKLAIEAGDPDLITIGQPVRRQVLRDQKSYVVEYRGSTVETFRNLADAQRWVGQQNRAPGDFKIRTSHDLDVVLMPTPVLDPSETQVYVNGHAIRVQFKDELLARAWNNMGAEHMNVVFRIARGINTWLSKAYTGYNPEFLGVNVVRDLSTGLANITGEEGAAFAARALARYPKSFAELLRYAWTGNASNSIAAYRADGGTTGAAYLSDLERIGKDIDVAFGKYAGVLEGYRSGGPTKAARVAGQIALDAAVGWIEKLNQAGENAMRLAVYRAAVEGGKTRAQAAALAKNSTVNFNRKGEVGQIASALYLFFNPAVQGTASIAHALFQAKHRHQAQALVGGMIGLGYWIAASMGGGPEDEWEKVGPFAHERFLHIWKGDGWARIPIPYGYGFFVTLGRQLQAIEAGGDPTAASLRIAESLVGEFTIWGGAADPDGDERNILFLAPTLVQIPGAVLINRTGLGSPIYPESKFDESKPDNQKMWRATQGTAWATTARELNAITGGNVVEKGWLDVSPETLKYLWRTATGGAGRFFTDSAQLAWNLTVEGLPVSDIETREVPLVRKFVQDENDIRGARSRFWEHATEVREAIESFRRAKNLVDADVRRTEMIRVREEQRERLALSKVTDRYIKLVAAKRDRIQAVMADQSKTLAHRRAAVRVLEREEAKIYDAYVEIFKRKTQ